MSEYSILKTTLQRMADITRALTGTNGEMTPMQMVERLGEIRVRRFDGEYTGEKLNSRNGNILTLVKCAELKAHRSDDSLRVTVHFDIAGWTDGAVKKIIAGNDGNIENDKDNTGEGTHQIALRWTPESYSTRCLNRYTQTDYRLDDDSSLTIGTARAYVTPEGELQIYNNANMYYFYPCKWTVIVEW